MSEGNDDTVAETPGASPSEQPDKPETIGRYRIERVLGVGGMGTVYAAFDPDLERRVALKLLNANRTDGELRARLLREARAMARLQHTNVVTVYEVGTEGGRDYVAMELVEGETLKAWLEVAKREPEAIVAAFIAAGQGLAAANAAGIVHRDFKPHNVLRRRDGRVMVTDFGLARGIEASAPVDVFETTITPGDSLSGLTRTGSVLGTPAYMAPEQWSGKVVGPRADQFSFCVALWEALTGERPFAADTFEALKAQVQKGRPDPSKLPRALREPLVRGLSPDPENRYATMNDLLDALQPRKRSALFVAGGAAAIALAAGVVVALRPAGGEAPCAPPVIEPASIVYKDLDRASVAAIGADLAHIAKLRTGACAMPAKDRGPRLACLDGLLTHVDLAARASHAAKVDATPLLVDPDVCTHPTLPRLLTVETPMLRDASAAWLADAATDDPPDAAIAKALVTQTAAEPCAAAFAHVLAAEATEGTERHQHTTDSESAAQLCGDDWISARLSIGGAQIALQESLLGADSTAKLRRAKSLADVVHDPGVDALLGLLTVQVAMLGDNLDQAIAIAKQSQQQLASRGIRHQQFRAATLMLRLERMRGKPEDLAALDQQMSDLHAAAVAALGDTDKGVRAIELEQANWMFARGDIARAHAAIERSLQSEPIAKPRHIAGVVLDPAGHPVEGALVGAAEQLRGDSVSAVLGGGGRLRITHTAADGTFELDAVPVGAVVAEKDGLRAPSVKIADRVTLKLAPTSRIEGKVDLAGIAPERVTIVARDNALSMADITYAVVAPVLADGSFVVDGVQRGKVIVSTAVEGPSTKMTGVTLDVKQPVVRGVSLSLVASKRSADVIVRSTIGIPLPNAQLIVLPGKFPAHVTATEINSRAVTATMRVANHIETATVPERIKVASHSGDLFSTLTDVPEGDAAVCALALPADLSDPQLTQKLISHLDKLEARCAPITHSSDVIILEVPPLPRLD